MDADDDPCTGAVCENGTCVPYMLSCAEGFICCGGECVIFCEDGGEATAPGIVRSAA